MLVRRPTKRDRQIFELLNHYRALDAQFIALFLGCDVETIRKRLKILAANRYVDFYNIEKQERYLGLNGYQWYCLSERGQDEIGSVYDHGNGSELLHEIGVQASIASLELGIRAAGHELFFPHDIIAHENFPEETRRDKHSPWSVPVAVSKDFGRGRITEEFRYRGDGFLWRRTPRGSDFFNIEFENKNRADSSNFNNTSFLKKFLAVEYIRNHGLCETRWGIPRESFLTLVLATSQPHIEEMKKVVMRETKERGAKHFLFYAFPALSKSFSVTPDPSMYVSEWQRAGLSNIKLSEV